MCKMIFGKTITLSSLLKILQGWIYKSAPVRLNSLPGPAPEPPLHPFRVPVDHENAFS